MPVLSLPRAAAPVLLFLSLLAAVPAPAQTGAADHDSHHAAAPAATPTEAEVRKVNRAAQTLTLKHGEIRNLGMGAMTMVFKVKDPALLNRVQAGDQVRFTAERVGDDFVVQTLERVRR